MTIDTNIYFGQPLPAGRQGNDLTYQGADEHLPKHQDLLHDAQRRKIDRRQPRDRHTSDAEEETVDIRYFVFGADSIHHPRENEWDLNHHVSSRDPQTTMKNLRR